MRAHAGKEKADESKGCECEIDSESVAVTVGKHVSEKSASMIDRGIADIRRGAPGEKFVAGTPCGLGYSIIFDYSDYAARDILKITITPWLNNQRL